MSGLQSILPENIILSIQENSGQIAIGHYVVQLGSIHGAVVNIALPEQRAPLRPRVTAEPSLLPPPALFLDRVAETETTLDYLRQRQSVEIYGLPGVGKTTLLGHLAQHAPAQVFPHGVVYLSARRKHKDDLLQELFDVFHEAEPHGDFSLKPTPLQFQRGLRDKKALIILDEAALDKDELRELQALLPSCSLLLASAERHWWRRTEGQALSLMGLPLENALELLEYELGRSLTSEEQLGARVLCAALEGHPDPIIQAAALVREERYSLPEVVYQSQRPLPEKGIAELALATLAGPEKQLVQALAVLEGASLPVEHLKALTGLPDTASLVEILHQRGLVRAYHARYRLAGNLSQLLSQASEATSYLERGLVYFTLWAETHRSSPARLLQDLEPLLQILHWAAKMEQWPEVLRLVRTMDTALALDKRWATWEQILQTSLQAAQAANNRLAEAWALHQLGSRALCLGETRLARTFLSQALELRETLGNYAGVVITRHNLKLLPPSPLPSSSLSSGSTHPNSNKTPLWPELTLVPLLVVVLAVLLPLLLLGWLTLGQSSAHEPMVEPPAPAMTACVEFESLSPHAYKVYESFSDSGVALTIKPFLPLEGKSIDQGQAQIEFYREGTQRQVLLQSASLGIDFDAPLSRLTMAFGYRTGNLNLEINDKFENFPKLNQIDGARIGDVSVILHQKTEFSGQLEFRGTIESFAIGGQEVWLDTICPQ